MNRLSAIIDQLLPDVDSRNWVYPQRISGRFHTWRQRLAWVLIGIMMIIPFLRIGEMPAILLDIGNRRFILFGHIFWPEDIWLTVFIVLLVFLGIVLFTAVAGRVWCGYACPQTVFLHNIFLRIERWIEGDRNQQIRLDKRPLDLDKATRKIAKHGMFLLASTVVAHIFLAYFMDVRELAWGLLHPGPEYRTQIIFTTLFTAIFYFDFAFLREQFCNYLCPYARFQSALLDRDSLIVAYDRDRGEPRRPIRRDDAGAQPAGDCVACSKCVLVCPQGIDIRDGLQLECIHCALCVDACDSVMAKVGRPTGLIRYASDKELNGEREKLVRPRTILYALLLVLIATIFVVQLGNRRIIDASLTRPPGAPWRATPSGEIANHFRVNIANKDTNGHTVALSLDAPDGWRLVTPTNPAVAMPGRLTPIELFVVAPPDRERTRTEQPVQIVLTDQQTGRIQKIAATVILPGGPHD